MTFKLALRLKLGDAWEIRLEMFWGIIEVMCYKAFITIFVCKFLDKYSEIFLEHSKCCIRTIFVAHFLPDEISDHYPIVVKNAELQWSAFDNTQIKVFLECLKF